MEKLTLVSFSHTDYSDIWPMTIEGINKISPEIYKIFACNKSEKDTKEIEKSYNEIIYYDDSLTYPQRLIYISSHIKSRYILLIHDIDICVNFKSEKINSIINTIEYFNIDRLIFAMVQKQNTIIRVDDMEFTNANRRDISKHLFTPYDVGVSIWNKETLVDCMNKFNNISYRDIEFSGIQDYLSTKNIVAFTPTADCHPIFQIGPRFSNYFTFLHVIFRGKWFVPPEYIDFNTYFKNLITKHNIDLDKRGCLDTIASNSHV